MNPGEIALKTLGRSALNSLLEDILKEQLDHLTYVQALDDLLEVEMDEDNREYLMVHRNDSLSYLTVLEQQLVVVKDYDEGKLTAKDLLDN